MGGLNGFVPEFGLMLPRSRLLGAFERHGLGATIMCAPPGYGKSVVASQLARLPIFDRAIWVSLYDRDASGEDVLAGLSTSLAVAGDETEPASSAVSSAHITSVDQIMGIREHLRRLEGEAVCLVVDGVNRLSDASVAQELANVIQECTSSRSRLVLTCRRIDSSGCCDPSRFWVVEASDLCFSASEVERLVDRYAVDQTVRPDAGRLMSRFGGQPALTSLALRHGDVDLGDGKPLDLVWYAERIVRAVPVELLPGLYAAAVMKDGCVGDLNAVVAAVGCLTNWAEVAVLTPLFALKSGDAVGRGSFHVHAVLGEAVSKAVVSRLPDDLMRAIRARVFEHLDCTSRHGMLESALETHASADELDYWLARVGTAILRATGPAALDRCLERIPPSVIAGNWRFLLLRAAILRQQEDTGEAMRHAQLAKGLAEIENDWGGVVETSLMVARLALDGCQFGSVRTVLGSLDAWESTRLKPEHACLVQSYLAVAESQTGLVVSAEERISNTRKLLTEMDIDSEEAVFAVNAVATVEGVCAGHWSNVATLLSAARRASKAAPLQRLLIRANYAAAVTETGRLSDAREVLGDVLAETEVNGLDSQRAYALGTLSATRFATGDVPSGRDLFLQCDGLHESQDDSFGHSAELAAASTGFRAAGYIEEALALAERAYALAAQKVDDHAVLLLFIRAELAASLLSAGDVAAAVRLASEARRDIGDLPLRMHLLRLDMVLAESERLRGDFDSAVQRIERHRQYILSGSANTMLSLYVRAFPGLLGVVTTVVGSRDIPAHMLRLLPESTMESALSIMRERIDSKDVEILAERVLQHRAEPATNNAGGPTIPPAASCYVRMLGGLEVTTDYGVVDDAAWRKRKSRLLFATLVGRRGQAIPRDVLLERFWSDMDEERACRNFHVTWNTMKKALVAGDKPSLGDAYVRSAGGACRVLETVRSDLDDLDDAIGEMRRSIQGADYRGAIDAARRVGEIYRGDLLPGDVYEDSFVEHREQLKCEFCDAMVEAAGLAEREADYAIALRFLRRVVAIDPWREDVYQAMMRCLINSGQRSRAIETYLYCRSKLVDDLGIDPSVETVRLYQTILAMEGDPIPYMETRSFG